VTAGAGGGEPAPSPGSSAEPPCQLAPSPTPSPQPQSNRRLRGGRCCGVCRAQGSRRLLSDVKPGYPASALAILEAPLQLLTPVPAVHLLLGKGRTVVAGGAKMETRSLGRSQNSRHLGTLMHFFNPQETTVGIWTVRNQAPHDRFPGIALKQQCSRSIYYMTIYHTSFLLSRTFLLR